MHKVFGVPIKVIDNCPEDVLKEAKTVAETERHKSKLTWYGNMTSTFKDGGCDVLNICPLLSKYIRKNVNEYLIKDLHIRPNNRFDIKFNSSWINYSTKHMLQEYHMHADIDISGVFYVNAVPNSGKIFFRNPSPNVLYHKLTFFTNEIDSEVSYPPVVGRMILWPGYLDHMVTRNMSDGERISFTFNIKLLENKIKEYLL